MKRRRREAEWLERRCPYTLLLQSKECILVYKHRGEHELRPIEVEQPDPPLSVIIDWLERVGVLK